MNLKCNVFNYLFCTVLTEFSESLVRVVVYDDFCCKEPHNSFTAEAKISVAKMKTLRLSQSQQRRKYQKSISLFNIDIGYSSISFSIVIIILFFISFVDKKRLKFFSNDPISKVHHYGLCGLLFYT